MTPLLLAAALAGTSDAQARLDRARLARAVPAGQRCRVDFVVTEGANRVGWRLVASADASLLVTTTQKTPQAVLRRGEETWFQTATMKQPLRADALQAAGRGVQIGDLLDPAGVLGGTATGGEGDVVQVAPVGKAGWRSATLTFQGAAPVSGRFYGPSGKVVREATWTWSGPALTGLVVTDATGARTDVALSAPACAAGAVATTSPTLMADAQALAAEPK